MSYHIEPRNKLFQALCGILAYEIQPGNTVTMLREIDLGAIEAQRASAALHGGTRPSYTAFVVAAAARALRAHPYANRRVARGLFGHRLQTFEDVDIGVAAERATEGEEFVAFFDVLRDADALDLGETTAWLRRLATSDTTTNAQWRQFRSVAMDLPWWLSRILFRLPWWSPSLWTRYRGGAVLVSSPAKYGADVVVATWPHPVGISFGLAADRPVVRDGRVAVGRTFTLTMSFDRRVMAGAQAARFFASIVRELEEGVPAAAGVADATDRASA